jgi:hypothetical protein
MHMMMCADSAGAQAVRAAMALLTCAANEADADAAKRCACNGVATAAASC